MEDNQEKNRLDQVLLERPALIVSPIAILCGGAILFFVFTPEISDNWGQFCDAGDIYRECLQGYLVAFAGLAAAASGGLTVLYLTAQARQFERESRRSATEHTETLMEMEQQRELSDRQHQFDRERYERTAKDQSLNLLVQLATKCSAAFSSAIWLEGLSKNYTAGGMPAYRSAILNSAKNLSKEIGDVDAMQRAIFPSINLHDFQENCNKPVEYVFDKIGDVRSPGQASDFSSTIQTNTNTVANSYIAAMKEIRKHIFATQNEQENT